MPRLTASQRAEIQSKSKTITQLALELNVTKATVRKWRNRDTTQDSSCAHTSSTTKLSRIEEAGIIELRKSFYLPLDAFPLICADAFQKTVTRSTIHRLFIKNYISTIVRKKFEYVSRIFICRLGKAHAYAFYPDKRWFVILPIKESSSLLTRIIHKFSHIKELQLIIEDRKISYSLNRMIAQDIFRNEVIETVNYILKKRPLVSERP